MQCARCNSPVAAGEVVCSRCGQPPEPLATRSWDIRRRDPKTRSADAAPEYGRDLTRYLCIAVHLDSTIAQATIAGVLGSARRAFPIAHGVDLAAVTRNALAGQRRHAIRDGLLVVLWLILIVSLARSSVFAFAAILGMWLVVLGEQIASHTYAVRRLAPTTFDPDHLAVAMSPRVERRLAEVRNQPVGNVTVYSGYSPFAGNGVVLKSWSFSIDVAKGTPTGGAVRPFATDALRQYVVQAVGDLRWTEIETEERLFVSGQNIRTDPVFLAGPKRRPKTLIDDAHLRAALASPEGSTRHYTAFYVSGWQGHMVLALFLRFVQRPRSLFVEASFSLLPPLDERFHAIDARPATDAFAAGVAAVRQFKLTRKSMISLPGHAILCFGRVGQIAARPLTAALRERAERQAVEAGMHYDFGAPDSVRELAGGKKYRLYFQQLDQEMYAKVIENRVLDAIVEFLDLHGVATDSLVERQTTILNTGVMVTGNASLKADNVTGAGSSVFNFRQFRGRSSGEGNSPR